MKESDEKEEGEEGTGRGGILREEKEEDLDLMVVKRMEEEGGEEIGDYIDEKEPERKKRFSKKKARLADGSVGVDPRDSDGK